MAAGPVTDLGPQQFRDRAIGAFRTGDTAGALSALEEGLEKHPNHAQLANTAGDIYLKSGDAVSAIMHFGNAAALEPQSTQYAINHAIALSAADRHHHALDVLRRVETNGRKLAVYCSTRGNAARGANLLAEAQEWYDHALAIEPQRPLALHGRARVAIERGDDQAVQWFDRALAVNSGDADAWLGKAQALDVAGDTNGARQIAEAIVQQAPGWAEGLRFLAQLRLSASETDFSSHYGAAAKLVPQDPSIYSEWCATLASLDFDEKAAEVAVEAQKAFPANAHFTFLEAVHASSSGQLDRAEAIFAKLEQQDDNRWLQEARHRIRIGEVERANNLVEKILAQDPWNISAWAIRGVVWRLGQDPKSVWLQEQEGLVQLRPLRDAETLLPEVVPFMHELHDRSTFPLGQSLRGGTQTRGNLFARPEPLLARLKEAIMETVEDYRQALPPQDAKHPLLRTRELQWAMEGAWSVRLAGGGDFHASHIHPQGIVSSALYLELPKDRGDDPKAGWLEIGRPAKDLGLEIGPLKTIEPKEGHLALFPSTLYHGTRPFRGDRRMTVAFDVNLQKGTPQ